VSEPSIDWKYKGPGFYYGIPADDITAEEYDALLPEDQRIVREAKEWTAVERKADAPKEPAKPGKHAGGDE